MSRAIRASDRPTSLWRFRRAVERDHPERALLWLGEYQVRESGARQAVPGARRADMGFIAGTVVGRGDVAFILDAAALITRWPQSGQPDVAAEEATGTLLAAAIGAAAEQPGRGGRDALERVVTRITGILATGHLSPEMEAQVADALGTAAVHLAAVTPLWGRVPDATTLSSPLEFFPKLLVDEAFTAISTSARGAFLRAMREASDPDSGNADAPAFIDPRVRNLLLEQVGAWGRGTLDGARADLALARLRGPQDEFHDDISARALTSAREVMRDNDERRLGAGGAAFDEAFGLRSRALDRIHGRLAAHAARGRTSDALHLLRLLPLDERLPESLAVSRTLLRRGRVATAAEALATNGVDVDLTAPADVHGAEATRPSHESPGPRDEIAEQWRSLAAAAAEAGPTIEAAVALQSPEGSGRDAALQSVLLRTALGLTVGSRDEEARAFAGVVSGMRGVSPRQADDVAALARHFASDDSPSPAVIAAEELQDRVRQAHGRGSPGPRHAPGAPDSRTVE